MSPILAHCVKGHDSILSTLASGIEESRLASALLFHGPAGVGKLTASLALIRALFCSAPGASFCGTCNSCHRLDAYSLLHPDLGILWPQSKRPSSSEAVSDPDNAPLDLHSIQEEVRQNQNWRILAEPARERLQELSLSPGIGPRRVLLVLSSERLSQESGNILLKTLEEPPGAALIILLCESVSALLPTIRSRCQICRFGPLPRGVVAKLLREEQAIPEVRARLLAGLSGGRLGLARTLKDNLEEYQGRRSLLTKALFDIRSSKSAPATLIGVQALLADPVEGIDDLSLLMDLLRDAMLLKGGCDPDLTTDPGSAASFSDLPLSAQEAANLLIRVEAAREDIRRNVNRQLALEALFLDLAGH